MKFQYLFWLASILAASAKVINVEKEVRKAAKLTKVVKQASIQMDANTKPQKENGKLKFKEEEDIRLEIDGVTETFRLKKQLMDTATPRPNGKAAAVYATTTESGMVVCRQECEDTDNCDMWCIKDGVETVYMHGNQALVISGGNGEVIDFVMPLEDLDSIASSLPNRRKRSPRFLRSLQGGITSSGVVKVIAFPDSKFMDLFMTLNSNNLNNAKTDVEYFLTLSANEMTMHYQSLKDYGLSMTRGVGGQSGALDISVQIVDVEFPSYDTNLQAFINFAWSKDNVNGDKVYYNKFYNGSYSANWGILYEFRDWLKDTYTTTVSYDHAVAITGYDLTYKFDSGTSSYESNTAGVAWRSTLCHSGYKYWGYHSSVLELMSGFSRLMSHELGHGMGSDHDGTGNSCSNEINIMSTLLFFPSTSTQDTYHKFSSCSANYINGYISSISQSDFISTCLSSPSQAFLTSFCQGFVGNYSPTKQCQLEFGSTSVPYPSSVQGDYVNRCVKDPQVWNPYPLYCSSGSSYYAITEVAFGTKCVSPDGSLENYICYEGLCVTPTQIC